MGFSDGVVIVDFVIVDLVIVDFVIVDFVYLPSFLRLQSALLSRTPASRKSTTSSASPSDRGRGRTRTSARKKNRRKIFKIQNLKAQSD